MTKTKQRARMPQRRDAAFRLAQRDRRRTKLKRAMMKEAWAAIDLAAQTNEHTREEMIEEMLLESPAMASNPRRLLSYLSPFQLADMSPGSSIDALLARLAMGYKGKLVDDGSVLGDWTYAEARTFRPSVDPSDALRLIERLALLKPSIELMEERDYDTKQTKLHWTVRLTSREDEEENVTAIAHTLPLAIARAAVKALARGYLSPRVERRLAKKSLELAKEVRRIRKLATHWKSYSKKWPKPKR